MDFLSAVAHWWREMDSEIAGIDFLSWTGGFLGKQVLR